MTQQTSITTTNYCDACGRICELTDLKVIRGPEYSSISDNCITYGPSGKKADVCLNCIKSSPILTKLMRFLGEIE